MISDFWKTKITLFPEQSKKLFLPGLKTFPKPLRFVYFLLHHLRGKGYECFQAPYFAGAQLAHFAEYGAVHAVFGPPGLLLYGITKLITSLDFAKMSFDWLHLQKILDKWAITLPQFVEACMLAGTEYCLTYPFLNLDQYQQPPASSMGPSSRFNFDAAVEIVKAAPLINWLQTFPSEEMKNDHVEGYCTCKVLLLHCPVYDISVGIFFEFCSTFVDGVSTLCS